MAIAVRVKVSGHEKALRRLKEAPIDVERGVLYAFEKGGRFLQGQVVRLLYSGGRTGRLYKRGATPHRASARGEAPATDYGQLANSIGVDVSSVEGQTSLELFAATDYAGLLEVELERPFLVPTVRKHKTKINQLIMNSVRARLRSQR